MAGDTQRLKDTCRKIIYKSAYKSFQQTFNSNSVVPDDFNKTKDIISDNFANTFSETLSPLFADMIAQYIESLKITHILTAPNGSVQGEIKIV